MILVDPGIDGSELNQLADDLDRLGIPVVGGFSTHPHWDHLLWHARFGDVPRYEAITVKAMDLGSKEVRIKARGYVARVIQHEVDHLDGILFVDRVEDRSTLREVSEEEADELGLNE